ncbi:MAG: mannose-1-phosphate guanylyltransferase [Acidobacteriota bacterium]|nr:mannose-1-phosphate guanylyltransferase [Acidobacteriota bacterium]
MATRKNKPSFHVLLLAGGSGTRLCPLSRARRPKQFLSLVGRDPLLLSTWKRARKLARVDRIWVVAPAPLVADVRSVLPDLGEDRLIVEPSPRDTAPAIALACATVARVDPDAVVGVFPTDHVIRDVPAFTATVGRAVAAAERGALVCLGIRPDRPATGFGYLKCATRPKGVKDVPVERFVEKPKLARAKRFLASGRYLWNGGMFVWRISRFFEELERTAPETARAVQVFVGGRWGAWSRTRKISVDYAVMEKAKGVRVVPLDAGWDDVGSWDAAARLREEAGIRERDQVVLDSPGSKVFGGDRTVVVVGVPGAVVVDTPDALLVVDRSRSEDIKKIVDELRRRRRKDLL